MPSSISRTTLRGLLISFFIDVPFDDGEERNVCGQCPFLLALASKAG
jgi:hypothetical protein